MCRPTASIRAVRALACRLSKNGSSSSTDLPSTLELVTQPQPLVARTLKRTDVERAPAIVTKRSSDLGRGRRVQGADMHLIEVPVGLVRDPRLDFDERSGHQDDRRPSGHSAVVAFGLRIPARVVLTCAITR